MKDQKGVTLIALAIAVIIMMILAGITFTLSEGLVNNINTSKSQILETELTEVQQVVLETYIKYKQTNNVYLIEGEKVTYSLAESYLSGIDNSLTLKTTNYDTDPTNQNIENYYYELTPANLNRLGIKNSKESYIVNYSTGEVFNYSTGKTENGDALYVYGVE